jgi:hypothetical protein
MNKTCYLGSHPSFMTVKNRRRARLHYTVGLNFQQERKELNAIVGHEFDFAKKKNYASHEMRLDLFFLTNTRTLKMKSIKEGVQRNASKVLLNNVFGSCLSSCIPWKLPLYLHIDMLRYFKHFGQCTPINCTSFNFSFPSISTLGFGKTFEQQRTNILVPCFGFEHGGCFRGVKEMKNRLVGGRSTGHHDKKR